MKPLLSLYLLCFPILSITQISPVDVAELTIKVGVGATETIYYGFAEGDQIIFSFEEVKGKNLKEIEIVELPGHSKFLDFKPKKIHNKRIDVYQKAVYAFSFKNTALSPRICRIKIKRIPATEDLVSFNTSWKWKEVYDTTYIPYTVDSLVGYDTLRYKETVKELVKKELVEELVFNKSQTVHSYWNENSSYTYLPVSLPKNIWQKYKRERTVAWAYWIGVGQEGKQAYAKNVRTAGKLATKLTSIYGSPLAGLAVGAITELSIPVKGDDVNYVFVKDQTNAEAFKNQLTYYYFDRGKGIAAYGRNTKFLNDNFFICLHNDNKTRAIEVQIKLVVIRERKLYDDITHNRQKITPRYVTLNKRKMEVNKSKVRINFN